MCNEARALKNLSDNRWNQSCSRLNAQVVNMEGGSTVISNARHCPRKSWTLQVHHLFTQHGPCRLCLVELNCRGALELPPGGGCLNPHLQATLCPPPPARNLQALSQRAPRVWAGWIRLRLVGPHEPARETPTCCLRRASCLRIRATGQIRATKTISLHYCSYNRTDTEYQVATF